MTFLRKLIQPSFKAGYARSSSESANPNLWDGLVGAWMPSLGVTGETLRDVSGNGNHGTLTNMEAASDWVTTSKGLALDFDGTNEMVDVDSPPVISGSSATYSLWVKANSVYPWMSPCGYVTSGFDDYRFLFRRTNAGLIQTFVRRSNSINFSAATPSGFSWYDWNHFLIVADGSLSQTYVNGSFLASNNSGSGNLNFGTTFTLGNQDLRSGGSTWNGGITNVKLYNRALSPTEIKQLYVDSLAPFRKKQQIAFNAYPATLLERIRSAAKPTTPVSVRVKHNEKPSYKTGYAKSAGESENPHLWNGLVGAWMPSLGVTGETLRDVSGNGNHGTLYNMDAATDWVATSKGLALDFDGVNDYVDVGSLEKINGTSQLSVCFWAKKPSASANTVVGSQQSGTNGFWLQWYSDSYVYWNPRNGTAINRPCYFAYRSGWVFLCGIYNASLGSSGLSAYANGIELSPLSEPTPPASLSINAADVFRIGSLVNSFYSNGNIRNVSIYNRALSPTEIKQLYVDSLAPFRRKKSPIGYQPNKELRGLFKV